eukprot:6916820-Pyramimonas_sp.AAC.1
MCVHREQFASTKLSRASGCEVRGRSCGGSRSAASAGGSGLRDGLRVGPRRAAQGHVRAGAKAAVIQGFETRGI